MADARTCPTCTKPLVRQEGETLQGFRVHCNATCAAGRKLVARSAPKQPATLIREKRLKPIDRMPGLGPTAFLDITGTERRSLALRGIRPEAPSVRKILIAALTVPQRRHS